MNGAPRRSTLIAVAIGAASALWLVLRSGARPDRLRYPCQRAALVQALGSLTYLASLVGVTRLHAWLRRRRWSAGGAAAVTVVLALLVGVIGGRTRVRSSAAAVDSLPAWTSASAVSSVFAVTNVPAPGCSVPDGTLPTTPPCNDPSVAMRDAGIERLFDEMDARGDYLYETASHPTGVVGANDVVVIKVNNQWGGAGSGDGSGRLGTSSDVLKGLIWRLLRHPGGFAGEIVVAENTQGAHPYLSDDDTRNNAEDRRQSIQDVVDAFAALGYPVTSFIWDDIASRRFTGGTIAGTGYPPGEYGAGETRDGYVLLDDPGAPGQNQYSYPKFHSAGGHDISMRYGIWNGSSYEPDRLKLINLPVLKVHCMAAATIAWKNFVGFVTIQDNGSRFGGWDEMHDYFWGYTGSANPSYGLIGRQMALVRAPDLNVVDAIWVATELNYDGDAVRQDVILASRDPFAVDWYASEYILRLVAASDPDSSSAARAGTFRNATRTNQDAAATVWPGPFPYIDLLSSNPPAPLAAEHDEMNAYVVSAAQPPDLQISIGDATVTEGPSGTLSATFPVSVYDAAGS